METQGLSQTTRLIRRNGFYHYRRRVQDEFVAAFGKKEIHRLLGTASLTEAKKRRAVEDLKCDTNGIAGYQAGDDEVFDLSNGHLVNVGHAGELL